jgi:bifunctional DNA-binding transcriptional regulator/antitoxin component of YhaV-PrlF toxin-antitoxin module
MHKAEEIANMSPTETLAEDEIPFIAEVIKGGRLTIPEEIRKLMRIEEGNYVLIRLKVVSRRRLGKKQKRNISNGNGGP